MREIKFRAWDKTDNVMRPVEQWANKSWIAVPIPSDDGYGGADWHLEQRRLDDVVLLQYTGLKDKNGKDIYEGDVIEFDQQITGPERHEVRFRYGFFEYFMVYDKAEVIGNIYENPELVPNT